MKAKERIERYGIERYINMLGKETVRKRGGAKILFEYYSKKYPKTPFIIPEPISRISKAQKDYWKKIKQIAKDHGISIKQARGIFKRERRKGKIKLIKQGEGYQLYILGIFKDEKIKQISLPTEGFSYVRPKKDYKKSFEECIRFAQAILGGSNWKLIKILKKEWIRFYGRKRANFKENDT